MKIAIEKALVAPRVINMDNVLSMYMFADAKTCCLLKEYALEYFVTRPEDVMQLESYNELKQSPELMQELLSALASETNVVAHGCTITSVYDLRKKLESKGLDVDGSREVLVTRLKSANKRKRTANEHQRSESDSSGVDRIDGRLIVICIFSLLCVEE